MDEKAEDCAEESKQNQIFRFPEGPEGLMHQEARKSDKARQGKDPCFSGDLKKAIMGVLSSPVRRRVILDPVHKCAYAFAKIRILTEHA